LYGSGDFAVAYIEQNGEITARAVCAPARKVYVRVYGDEARLDKLLQDAGFKRTGYHNPGPWMGLKLLKKHFWPGFYADFGGHFKDDPNDGQYMVIY
jgi:hypothetical protein